ncbi:MAG: hypothetical protein IKR56_08780 [Lachnospiraceae bacterium]|nr:hypothetical protein [Lachnospiraceae bacterium]
MKCRILSIILALSTVGVICACGKQEDIIKETVDPVSPVQEAPVEEKNVENASVELDSEEKELSETEEIRSESAENDSCEVKSVGEGDALETESEDETLEESEPEIKIEDVSWNHSDPMPYDDSTEIYFKLSTGESVTKEIVYGTNVEGMDELDIDGDGENEIVINQYFLNSVTEYSVINIYKLIDGKVEEIYPGTDIPELKDELINTEIKPLEKEGLPKYVLESTVYQKEEGEILVKYHGFLVRVDDGWKSYESEEQI